MKNHLVILRTLLGLIALGAAYVFFANTGFGIDTAAIQLRAASQVLIVVGFLFLMYFADNLLPEKKEIVDSMIKGIVGFFVIANSLPLIIRVSRGTFAALEQRSGLSGGMLLAQHVFNIVIIPCILWFALSLIIKRVTSPKKPVNEILYWGAIVVGVVGLAYVSMTPTWTLG